MSADATPAAAIHVSGSPTADELAALVVVLSALGGGEGGQHDDEHGRSAWSDPSWRLVGPSARHGGWRSSTGLPR